MRRDVEQYKEICREIAKEIVEEAKPGFRTLHIQYEPISKTYCMVYWLGIWHASSGMKASVDAAFKPLSHVPQRAEYLD
jgi:hypothetical protein